MGHLNRRDFMVGCSAAIAAMTGSRLNFAAFGNPVGSTDRDILVYLFLRGGMDGLSLVPPIDGPDRGPYEAARPYTRIPTSGDNPALDLDGQFGLHAAAAPLHPLFQDGKLAIVQAAGLDSDTRSHFVAMESIELGTPERSASDNGWLARHLASSENLGDDIIMPSVSLGGLPPTSLLGNSETLMLGGTNGFDINTGHWRWVDAQRIALRRLYRAYQGSVHESGLQALTAMDIFESYVRDDYQPANGAEYPRGSFGDQMKKVAQLIKLGLGLSVATVDLGGWDTHDQQGVSVGGYFGRLVSNLAQGMAALYTDLDAGGNDNLAERVTVVVQSEFGRRLRENADRGTDHGHGNTMLVLGGSVNGGLYGEWPGLTSEQLYDGADLAVTTDYRRVLSEILIRRLGNARLDEVFPGYMGYEPIGVVQGSDLPPVTGGGSGPGGISLRKG